MRARRGFTLVEITVACFLLSILLVVSAELLLPAMRAWTDGQHRSEVFQSLLVTTNWIGDDVVRSSPESLNLTEQDVLVMSCSRGLTVDGENQFGEEVAYWPKEGNLYRAARSGGSSTGPPDFSLDDLSGLDSNRRVALGVKSFDVTIPQPWRVELYMKVERDGRSAEIQTSYTSIYAPFDRNLANEEASQADGSP